MLKDIVIKEIKSLFWQKGIFSKQQRKMFLSLLKRFIYGCAGCSLLCRVFSSCAQWGLIFIVVRALLIAVALLLWSTGSRYTGFSSGSSWALEHSLSTQAYSLRSMTDHPGSGIKPMFPELAGRFFTTEPPGKPIYVCVCVYIYIYTHTYIYITFTGLHHV